MCKVNQNYCVNTLYQHDEEIASAFLFPSWLSSEKGVWILLWYIYNCDIFVFISNRLWRPVITHIHTQRKYVYEIRSTFFFKHLFWTLCGNFIYFSNLRKQVYEYFHCQSHITVTSLHWRPLPLADLSWLSDLILHLCLPITSVCAGQGEHTITPQVCLCLRMFTLGKHITDRNLQ